MDKLLKQQKELAQIVAKGNRIVRQWQLSLPLQEQKIFLYVLSKIKPEDEAFYPITISVKEFGKLLGLKDPGGKDYIHLKKNILKLAARMRWMDIDDETEAVVSLIEKPSIKKRNGVVTVRLDKHLQPFLLNLKTQYTSYSLQDVWHMKSSYAIRLYEILKSFDYKRGEMLTHHFTIPQFREWLDCVDIYKDWRNFKKWVIDTAVSEINAVSNYYVEYETFRLGREIYEIEFTMREKRGLEEYRETEDEIARRQMKLEDVT